MGFWRKGWDSNPRYPCRHAGFQDRFLKPLGHPSKPLAILAKTISDEWAKRLLLLSFLAASDGRVIAGANAKSSREAASSYKVRSVFGDEKRLAMAASSTTQREQVGHGRYMKRAFGCPDLGEVGD